jgi:hypothetical protein
LLSTFLALRIRRASSSPKRNAAPPGGPTGVQFAADFMRRRPLGSERRVIGLRHHSVWILDA